MSKLSRERDSRAGCILLARSRKTGALRGVYLAEAQGLDPSGGKWVVVCETHSTILNVDTRADALRCDTDTFCDDCREAAS